MPFRKQNVDGGQAFFTVVSRRTATVHQLLEIAFQMGPAQRPLLGREPLVGGPAVGSLHTRKIGAQQRVHDRAAAAPVDPKHGQLGGHGRP